MSEHYTYNTDSDSHSALRTIIRAHGEEAESLNAILNTLGESEISPEVEAVLVSVLSNDEVDIGEFAELIEVIRINPENPDLSRWQKGGHETLEGQGDAILGNPDEYQIVGSDPVGNADSGVVGTNNTKYREGRFRKKEQDRIDEITRKWKDAALALGIPPEHYQEYEEARLRIATKDGTADDYVLLKRPIPPELQVGHGEREVVPSAFQGLSRMVGEGGAGATGGVPEIPVSAPAEPEPEPEPESTPTFAVPTPNVGPEIPADEPTIAPQPLPPVFEAVETPVVSHEPETAIPASEQVNIPQVIEPEPAPDSTHEPTFVEKMDTIRLRERARESYENVYLDIPTETQLAWWMSLSPEDRLDRARSLVPDLKVKYERALESLELTRQGQNARRWGLGFLLPYDASAKVQMERGAKDVEAARDRYLMGQIELRRLQNLSLGDGDRLDSDSAYSIANSLYRIDTDSRDKARTIYKSTNRPNTFMGRASRGISRFWQNRKTEFVESEGWRAINEKDRVRKVAQWLGSKLKESEILHTGIRYAVPAASIAVRTGLSMQAAVPILASLAASRLIGYAGGRVRDWRHWNTIDANTRTAEQFDTVLDAPSESMRDVITGMSELWKSQDRKDKYFMWAQTLATVPIAMMAGDLSKGISLDSLHKIKDAVTSINLPDVKMPTIRIPDIKMTGIDSGPQAPLIADHASPDGLQSAPTIDSVEPDGQLSPEQVPQPLAPEQPKAKWYDWRGWFGKDDVTPAQQPVSPEPAASAPANPNTTADGMTADRLTEWHADKEAPLEELNAGVAHETSIDQPDATDQEVDWESEVSATEVAQLEGLKDAMYTIRDGDGFTDAFQRMLGPGGLSAGQTPDWFTDRIAPPLGPDGFHYDMNADRLSAFAHRMGLINDAGESIVMEQGDKIGFDSLDRLTITRGLRSVAVTDSSGNPLGGLIERGFEFKKF